MAGPAARRWWQLGAQFPRLPTVYDAHQRAVPRLPIPTLEESCAKYLRHLAPLQSAAEHGATRRAVAATLDSTIARDVQAALVRAAELTGGDSVVSEHLGDVLLLRGDKLGALGFYEEAVTLDVREDEQPNLYDKLESLRRDLGAPSPGP